MPDWSDPCPACPRKYRAIGGSGPQPARILCIAERPGKDENAQGRVLVGKTGQEWDETYLPLAGLDRSEVRVCNAVMCWADNNRTPSDKEIRQCAAHHIPYEIERTNPELIVLMGASACSLVSGIRLDFHHGIPQPTSKVGDLFGWQGWLVPMFHPAIGLHESRWMTQCLEDWTAFRSVIEDHCLVADPKPEPTHYAVANGKTAWVKSTYPVGVDTESHAGKPWSIQVSSIPNCGVLYLVSDRQSLDYARWMLNCEHDVAFHNAAVDLDVLRRLDIHVRSYRDTMQEAFHLGNLPQGLKPLSYRLFRHTMTSYNEVVWPASIRALIEWMCEALIVAVWDLAHVQRVQLKTKVKEIVKPGALESLLSRLLRLTSASSDYNPWGDPDEPRLNEFWRDPLNEWMVAHVEARIGPYPVLGIKNCALPEAVEYGVGDADWTGRAAAELERRRGQSFRIYEGDRDQ